MAKLAIVEEEADETSYWLELLIEAKIVPQAAVAELQKECDAIVAMTVASIKTLRIRQSKIQNRKSKMAGERESNECTTI